MMVIDNELIRNVQTTATISDLPEEVLALVLVRLSIKDVVACVCVKRSWYSLIKTRMFVTLHSNYHHKISSSSNPSYNKYLLVWNTDTEAYEIRVDDIQCELYLTPKYPPHLSDLLTLQLVSNGLICLFDLVTRTTSTIHLWNPVIQKCKTLPDSPHHPYSDTWTRWEAIAFGFIPQINDYLVVYMIKHGLEDKPDTQYIVTCVYSLNTNSWKKITHHDSINIVDIRQQDGVCFNGVAAWAGVNARGDRVLLCFDTKAEMLREILLPEWVDQKRFYPISVIHAFDQSLAYIVEDDDYLINSQLGVWVLKCDPMNEFIWEKKMTVALHEDVEGRVMGIRNNGEPILVKWDHDLIAYNLDSHKSYDFVKSRDDWIPFFPNNEDWDNEKYNDPFRMIKPFAESLGLLDIA